MKTILIIPDGVGIRNFLCTRFMDLLRAEGEVLVWHGLSETIVAPHRQRWTDGVTWRALPSYRETVTERILRQAKVYAQLYWQYDADRSGEVLRLSFRYPSHDWRHRQVTRLSQTLGHFMGHAAGVQWLDRQHARTVARRAGVLQPFLDVLRQERANLLFCTHQRASRAVPAMLAARQAGIPTVTFIYSWDNLSKGRMAVHADHFLVWSEYMKAEMARYYPEVDARRVHITGTPQFEPYFDTGLIQPRDVFLARHGLSPNRPVVCFSGDDQTTSPYDQVFLADLAASLRTVPAERRPQILFRRCPTEPITRFQATLQAFPEIKVSDPLWATDGSGDWTQTVPTPGDVALLVNLVRHCDVVVNVASTMAMDFAIYDKPAIYVAYTPEPRLPHETWLDVDLYRYPHFRVMHRLCPLYWVREPAAFARMLDYVLTHRAEKQRERQAWVECHAAPPLADSSRRCVQALLEIAARPAGAGDRPPAAAGWVRGARHLLTVVWQARSERLARGSASELTAITQVFRNPTQLALLAQHGAATGRRPIHVVVYGVADGSEAVSLFVHLRRAGLAAGEIEIVGRDIRSDYLDAARDGVYLESRFHPDCPPQEFPEFFSRIDGQRWRTTPEVRGCLTYALANVLERAPGEDGRFDLVVCQNVLVHLTPTEIDMAIANLVRRLAPGGLLAVGGGPLGQAPQTVLRHSLTPVLTDVERIHEGWSIQRYFHDHGQRCYWALEPYDPLHPEGPVRYCTLFAQPPRRRPPAETETNRRLAGHPWQSPRLQC